MLEVLLLGAVVVLAGVGLHQRKTGKSKDRDESASERDEKEKRVGKKATNRYVMSLAVPCTVALIFFLVCYIVPPDQWSTWMPMTACRMQTPEEMAADWDYVHDVEGLKNVSESSVVQTLFNQGLLLRWGYSLENANDAFSAALRADQRCAMCFWGMAYAVSPFANIAAMPAGTPYPYFSDSMNKEGRHFLQMAETMQPRTEKEAAYIKAMWIRFPDVNHVERRHQEWMEFLYGARMLMLWKEDPADLIAASLAAEAFANCMPWDYYAESAPSFEESITWKQLMQLTFPERDTSNFAAVTGWEPSDVVLDDFPLKPTSSEKKVRDHRMRPLARVVEHLILKILEANAAHPMATHLHIHLTEASMANDPGKGFPSALKLAEASRQWKSGHLIHMPSHTFLRVGEYKKGVEVNEAALGVDIDVSNKCMDPYLPEHNLAVLIASASMGGLFDKAEEYAIRMRTIGRKIVSAKYIPSGWDYVTLFDVWGHFGKWDKILSAAPPSINSRGIINTGGLEFATAMYQFYRYMALSHTQPTRGGRSLLAAEAIDDVLVAFEKAARSVEPTDKTIPGEGVGIYSAAYFEKTKIAMLYAQARNATLHGDIDAAVGFMEDVVKAANDLGYMEPPWTQQSPKQCLGYLLLHGKKYDEAKKIYEQDLGENPRNPWSILGLAQLYQAMQMRNDAETMMFKFSKSGSVELGSSCPMLEVT